MASYLNSVPVYSSIYRTIELSDGWPRRGESSRQRKSISVRLRQLCFAPLSAPADGEFLDVLDGAMIALAIYTLNAVHPAIVKEQEESQRERKSGSNSSPTMIEI